MIKTAWLHGEEKMRCRKLSEICFPEDSVQFTDYYYREKCADNRILAAFNRKEEVVSMIHANPFTLCLYGQRIPVPYLVCVGTAPEWRRQGLMRNLMEQTLRDCFRRGEAFSFLMPANPAYYTPMGFRYWKNQLEWTAPDKNSLNPAENEPPASGEEESLVYPKKEPRPSPQKNSLVLTAEHSGGTVPQARPADAGRKFERENPLCDISGSQGCPADAGRKSERKNPLCDISAPQAHPADADRKSEGENPLCDISGSQACPADAGWKFEGGNPLCDFSGSRIRPADPGDAAKLAEFANRVLAERTDLFVCRDAAYYRRLLKEQQSENGGILMRTAEDGRVTGSVCWGDEGRLEFREPIASEGLAERIRPLMMGRIVCLERFVEKLRFQEPFSAVLSVRDEILPENNGAFHFSIDSEGGRLRRVSDDGTAQRADIAKLGEYFFARMRIYLNELV